MALGQRRKKHSDEFKARVALEAVKGVKTLSELSSAYGVHPTLIGHWKRQLIAGSGKVFSRASGGSARSEEEIVAPLYEEIGRLKMELDWLKKKL
jgi:transposase-like protein